MRTDEELARAACAEDDADALDELINRYFPIVWRTVNSMLVNEADSDDVVQTVFMKMVRGLPRFGQRSQFKTWIYRIAMNTTYTFIGQRGRQPEQSSDDAQVRAPEDARPEERSMLSETEAAIGSSIEQLSPPLRAAIVLTAIEGQSAREAAEIEGVTTATLYWRIHEARKQLRGLLAPYLG